MKHLLFIVVVLGLILAEQRNAKAGGWRCNNYLIEFTLRDNSIVQGHYLDGNYFENIGEFQQDSFMHYLRIFIAQHDDSITIFRKIEILEYPQMDLNPVDSCAFKLTCAYPNNVVNLNIADIKSVKLIGISPCGVCDSSDGGDAYYWNGISPSVITELTAHEIELLNSKPINDYHFLFSQNTASCYVLNYNDKIDETAFKEICNNLQNEIEKGSYSKVMNDLRQKNIILIHLEFAL